MSIHGCYFCMDSFVALTKWFVIACHECLYIAYMQVDDVVSRVQDLDFSSLRSQLGPLATVSA